MFSVQVSVCIGELKTWSQGGHCAWIIKCVMEGVHEEFRLALRENKLGERVWVCVGMGEVQSDQET